MMCCTGFGFVNGRITVSVPSTNEMHVHPILEALNSF